MTSHIYFHIQIKTSHIFRHRFVWRQRVKESFHVAEFWPNFGVNFINVLRQLFSPKDPESAKKTVKMSVFFALLGSAPAKAARITFMNTTATTATQSSAAASDTSSNQIW